MAQPDPDDIYRELDEENEDACAAEITRLKRKRKGLRSTFTEILNIIDRLITASRGMIIELTNLRTIKCPC